MITIRYIITNNENKQAYVIIEFSNDRNKLKVRYTVKRI